MKTTRKYDPKRILLADDEPEHLEWLLDYLKAKGYSVDTALTVKSAAEAAQALTYRAYLVDLNIPMGGWKPTGFSRNATYDAYAGLYMMKLVRSQGSAGTRVIAYSAHQNEQITLEIDRLYSNYVLKGRPRELKQEIERVLSVDPQIARRSKSSKPAATRRKT